MTAWHGGKGDWIPGTNDAAYRENYPAVDWDARGREERRCKGTFTYRLSNPPQPFVKGCTCGSCNQGRGQ